LYADGYNYCGCETTFLLGDLEEEIYMNLLDSMEEGKSNEQLLLLKVLYGLV